MEIHPILVLSTVNFGIMLIDSSNQNEKSAIQNSLQNFFISMARNDSKGFKTHHQTLKEEVVHNQAAFHQMEGELRKVKKYKHPHSLLKREMADSSSTPDYKALYEELKMKLERINLETARINLEISRMKLEESEMKLEESKMKFEESEMKLEEPKMKLEEVKIENWVLHCGEEHKYAIRYFEQIFTEAHNHKLPNFRDLEYKERERTYSQHIKTNPTVCLDGKMQKKFEDLNEIEKIKYHGLYHYDRRLTQKEMWIIGPQWLVESDEYKKIVSSDKVYRLEVLVSSIRPRLDANKESLSIKMFTFCILRNWHRLSQLVKVSPHAFNYKGVYEYLLILAGAPLNHAEHCSFLLEEALMDHPHKEHEKKCLKKFWTGKNFQPWELDLDPEVPDLPLDLL